MRLSAKAPKRPDKLILLVPLSFLRRLELNVFGIVCDLPGIRKHLAEVVWLHELRVPDNEQHAGPAVDRDGLGADPVAHDSRSMAFDSEGGRGVLREELVCRFRREEGKR